MIIACGIDYNYIGHCAVMLKSLYDSNPEEEISVYILHGPINKAYKAKLAAYLGTFLSSVSFIRINEEELKSFPEPGHPFSITVYYRFLLPAVLPGAVQKVLFLDCDLLIVDSLSELWRTSLDGYSLAAVIERDSEELCKSIGLSKGSAYFNAGVMLIDINKWRKGDLIRASLDFIKNFPAKKDFADQDMLNYYFDGKWLSLDKRWNALPYIWGLNKELKGEAALLTLQEKAVRDNPAVVHFAGAGPCKPWNYYCLHPWRMRYLEIKKETPWARAPLEPLPSLPLLVRWWFRLFRLFSKLKRLIKGK